MRPKFLMLDRNNGMDFFFYKNNGDNARNKLKHTISIHTD